MGYGDASHTREHKQATIFTVSGLDIVVYISVCILLPRISVQERTFLYEKMEGKIVHKR